MTWTQIALAVVCVALMGWHAGIAWEHYARRGHAMTAIFAVLSFCVVGSLFLMLFAAVAMEPRP
jgi:hypothetical protein